MAYEAKSSPLSDIGASLLSKVVGPDAFLWTKQVKEAAPDASPCKAWLITNGSGEYRAKSSDERRQEGGLK